MSKASKSKEEQYKLTVIRILSDLYNGLSTSDFDKNRYANLRGHILNMYKKLDAGAYATPLIGELLDELNREVLKNYKLNLKNPSVFTSSIYKLEKALKGPSSGLWLADYAAIFKNLT